MLVGGGVNELSVDPHAVANTLHAALEDGRHAQLPGDLTQALVGLLVAHHRGA